MATYEAYVTLGNATVAISTVEIPLSVRSETGDVSEPIALLTLILPKSTGHDEQKPRIQLIRKPEVIQHPQE